MNQNLRLIALVCCLAALILLMPSFRKTQETARRTPQLAYPAQFRMKLSLFDKADSGRPWTAGDIELFVKDMKVRTHFHAGGFERETIHRDGIFYVLRPQVRRLVQGDDSVHWIFKTPQEWKFLRMDGEREVYQYETVRKGASVAATIWVDPKWQVPTRVENADGRGWQLISYEAVPQPAELFEVKEGSIPPAANIDGCGHCAPSQNCVCSGGWSCGDPCPGGICC